MVIMVSFPFLARPDFWGEVIDLVGLAALLSNDIDSLAWLRRLLGSLPSLQRLAGLGRIDPEVVKFIRGFPPVNHPERLTRLDGADAQMFLSLFPNRKSEGISGRLEVCAINFSPSADRLSVWIYAAEPTEAEPNLHAEPIAGPIPYEEFVNQTERKKQNVIYTAGFVLMAVGSILTLLHVVVGGS